MVIQQQDTIKELREHVEHIQGQLDALSNNAAQNRLGDHQPQSLPRRGALMNTHEQRTGNDGFYIIHEELPRQL